MAIFRRMQRSLRHLPAAVLMASILGFTGCATLSGPTLEDWESQELKVVRVVLNGARVPVPTDKPITLTFAPDGKVAGRSTVNRYFGAFSRTDNGAIVWTGAMGATRMAGPAEAMKTESEYFQALGKTSEIRVGRDLLIFQTPDQENIVELKRN